VSGIIDLIEDPVEQVNSQIGKYLLDLKCFQLFLDLDELNTEPFQATGKNQQISHHF